MTVAEAIERASYVSLTTFRRDGSGVATPVWHTVHDGEVLIVSNLDAWKVKRIRNGGHVTLTPCDIRGRIKPGAATVEGTARLLDDAGTAVARRELARKYFMSRAGNFFVRVLHLKKPPVIGIAVALGA